MTAQHEPSRHETSQYDRLPDAVTEIFGEEATAEHAYDLLTVDVPPGSWIAALEIARDKLGCTYFDWLSAVDEPGTGFRICAHVVALEGRTVRRLLLRTTVAHEAASLPSAVAVYAGASWHERETYEMFGVTFTDHPHLVPLLLPEGFEGHPLRKDFVLAARVAKAWPGAKEPGESEHGGPKRRQMLPPGVPDPNEWGPLKGQLPPAPARPARTPRAAAAGAGAGAGAAGERPPRRARSVSEGSASQAAAQTAASAEPRPRRARSASEGSASQTTPEAPSSPEPSASAGPRRTRSAGEGSASVRRTDEPQPAADKEAAPPSPSRPRSSDAPWHHARPAFDDGQTAPQPTEPRAAPGPEREPAPEGGASEAAPAPTPEQDPAPEAAPARETAPAPDAPSEPDAAPAPDAPSGPDAAPEPGAPRPQTGSTDGSGDPGSDTDEPNRPDGGDPA
ncbi:NADH-quinone oxidoreductase subunit C [Streptomyces sp. NPDC002187]|uniref:NADH-quinone oxidoreductase subunit C n=1 Tax=Streptomyces sp. NPDC002187 TaxID=3364637 RepID=UPI0036974E84